MFENDDGVSCFQGLLIMVAVPVLAIAGYIHFAHAQPAPPSVGVWSLVKHVRFPLPSDEVIGRYPSQSDCQYAAYTDNLNKQWWTTYSCELRALLGKPK